MGKNRKISARRFEKENIVIGTIKPTIDTSENVENPFILLHRSQTLPNYKKGKLGKYIEYRKMYNNV